MRYRNIVDSRLPRSKLVKNRGILLHFFIMLTRKVLKKFSSPSIIGYIAATIILIIIIWPDRYAKYYEYIEAKDVYDNLVPETTSNISLERLIACEYDDIIFDNDYLFTQTYRSQLFNSDEIRLGGEYTSDECRPKFSSAIIIPYRKREEQLHSFLIYMHNFLRKQRIHYRIFLIEQYDEKPFNRAKLFNIGYEMAIKFGFPCLILHDVDLMPMSLGQIYACTEQPRHMCSSLDKFRYNLPYLGLFGGAVAIRTEQFKFVNGMSNLFTGWGGEDDDFYGRLKAKNIEICRFSPDFSKYIMLRHGIEEPNEERMDYLHSGPKRYHTDGLNSLKYKLVDIKLHSLFTHVLVET
ncbi:beta-1,4-galactosyltransferase 1 [Condylostylus longicornis]|uniref:beta-1,4-galactosyltransferase 1 n=1 Tax=Condylostylus longicornis TaxID=2530218 RepID=UPI00244DDA95|nr:beta-1,4-galactosyltransferase 1 [Condylostylus longicornis]